MCYLHECIKTAALNVFWLTFTWYLACYSAVWGTGSLDSPLTPRNPAELPSVANNTLQNKVSVFEPAIHLDTAAQTYPCSYLEWIKWYAVSQGP